MIIFPAIDLYDKKAVRLFKGDYSQMKVYSDDPLSVAEDFKSCGAEYVHMVDLEGARDGNMPNFDIVKNIAQKSGLKVEIGGGIRSANAVYRYLEAGVSRVILGTAAVTDPEFLRECIRNFGDSIAVGADFKDGFAAIKGWTEKSALSADELCKRLCEDGVATVICTDISKDGAMKGTNIELYNSLTKRFALNFIASGGVSGIEDISKLKECGVYGAIIGKAYYIKAIDLKEAIRVAK